MPKSSRFWREFQVSCVCLRGIFKRDAFFLFFVLTKGVFDAFENSRSFLVRPISARSSMRLWTVSLDWAYHDALVLALLPAAVQRYPQNI